MNRRRRAVAAIALWMFQLFSPPLFAQEPTPSVRKTGLAVIDIPSPDSEWEKRPQVVQALSQAAGRNPRFRALPSSDITRFRDRVLGARDAETEEALNSLRRDLTRSKDLYGQLKFREALTLLEDVRRGFIENLSALRSNRDLLDVHLFLGTTNAALKNVDAAKQEFAKVVYLDPNRELSTRDFSPKTVALFTSTRQEILAQEPSDVRIEAAPMNGSVYLNGRSVGRTPLLIKLRPGEYFFLVEAKGRRPWFKPVHVKRRIETVRAELESDDRRSRWVEKFGVRDEGAMGREDASFFVSAASELRVNLFFLGALEKEKDYRLLGQLYDARTGDFSPVASLSIGSRFENLDDRAVDMMEALSGFVRPDGYLMPREGSNLSYSPSNIPVAASTPVPDAVAVASPPPKAWYRRWWVWPLLIGVGVGGYYGSQELGSTGGSKVILDNKGNF